MYFQRKRWQLSRRTFLRGTGVSLALPWLEAMGGNSTSFAKAGSMTDAEIPRRAYFSSWGFFEAGAATPKDTGLNYTLTPTLSPLEPYKKDFTYFSGMQAFTGGHNSACCLLTGMNTYSNGVKLVSVDQQIADFYQGQTRVPSLVLALTAGSSTDAPGRAGLSWSRNKTPIAYEGNPKAVFDRLFLPEDSSAVQKKLNHEQSILDVVKGPARDLEKKLGKEDRSTLDQFLTSVRNVEERIQIDHGWIEKPKPKPPVSLDFSKAPRLEQAWANDEGTAMGKYLQLMFDVIVFAFQTDSTRVVAHNPKGEGGPVFKEMCQGDVIDFRP